MKPVSEIDNILREIVYTSGRALALAAHIAELETHLYGEFMLPDGTIWDLTFKKRVK